MMTVSAPVSVMPCPPARVESKKAKSGEPAAYTPLQSRGWKRVAGEGSAPLPPSPPPPSPVPTASLAAALPFPLSPLPLPPHPHPQEGTSIIKELVQNADDAG